MKDFSEKVTGRSSRRLPEGIGGGRDTIRRRRMRQVNENLSSTANPLVYVPVFVEDKRPLKPLAASRAFWW
jgi:hypothetical protein